MSNILPGRYIVTGASGLIGMSALKALSNTPDVSVRAIVHSSRPQIIADNVSYLSADLTQRSCCKEVIKDADYLFMFAGILSTTPMLAVDPISHIMSNLAINAYTLESAYLSGIKKVLWVSTPAAYSQSVRTANESDMFKGDPPDNYFAVGWMTRYIETLCKFYATKLKSMNIVIIRPTTVYGENEGFDLKSCHILPALVRKVVERYDPIEIWSNPEQTKDLIHADDVIEASLLAFEKAKRFDVFNVGYGKEYSIKELLGMVMSVDNYAAKVFSHFSENKITRTRTIDLSKSKRVLNFKPNISIKQGISRLILECKSHISGGGV
jgi:GDP-L-fucose synthase